MKPRMVCGCHLVIFAISAPVAPSLRRRSSRTALFFDRSRASGWLAFAAGLTVLMAAGLPPRADLGAPFFWLAFVVALASAGATAAPCGVTAESPAALAASVFV